MSSSSALFTPLKIGNAVLSNRLVMAPLTRFRADENHVPLPFVSEYYSQRASVPGTLLITEATFIHPSAGGYANVPGIWSPSQIEGWKKVTDSVHAKKSFIYLQLWALGRVADPSNLAAESEGKWKVKSASDVPFEGGAIPEALTESEIWEYVGWYKQAALNAVEAGFDGVEIHGANGYLIDQFLQSVTNTRTDAWGGSAEKRARFGIEVAKAVTGAVGKERTAIRLSPYSNFQGMRMGSTKEIEEQFGYVVGELQKLGLSYLHLVESRVNGNADTDETEKLNFLIDIWGSTSPVLIAGGFTAETAKNAADVDHKGKDVGIVFGRYFISNPDLVYRIKEGLELRKYDSTLFYNRGEKHGYTDYGFSEEFLGAQKLLSAQA